MLCQSDNDAHQNTRTSPGSYLLTCDACPVQVQAEQALQNITAAMEQASGHRQEAAVLKNQLAADQVILHIACLSVLYLHS